MVKFLSVDWLAQSHSCDSGARIGESQMDTAFKPHIPCMVQPSAPSYGKGYLQLKAKTGKNADLERNSESGLCSPRASCTSPISEISEYSSGYESEAASSECSASEDVSEAGLNQRRVRTKFTPDQISRLEKIFLKHKYLDAGERVKTAQKLKLTETQIRTWFQNRRMKLKREVQDYLTPQVPPMLLHAFPPTLPYHYPHPHPHPHTHPQTHPTSGPGFYPGPPPHMLHHHQQTMVPQSMVPQSMVPQSMVPQSMVPQSMVPQSMVPQSMVPQSMVPQSMVPQSMVPQSMVPQSMVPQSMVPQSMVPQSMVPQSMVPQSMVQQPMQTHFYQ
ncbi:unnamed protein product [Knipowitschia caucasica]|uniref:Homeobox domain-containing protein n=1 Tax=Knipowitschia caucasica TaxID=637954 RepID=A0AAV2JNY5_KNICA